MRAVFPHRHSTQPVEYATFLRLRIQHLRALPVLVDGRAYFLLHKEHTEFDGEVWMRLEPPYTVQHNGRTFAVEFSLWHGVALAVAERLRLLSCSSNHGHALCFNWPRAPRRRGRVIVSRLLGMSLSFNEEDWFRQGYHRFDERLHVHHDDDVHYNCFLRNLVVIVGGDHVAMHNRER